MRDALGKSKVSNLPNTSLEEYISRLEITVNDVFFGQILTALGQLIGDDAPLDTFIILGIFF
jgi:hypothetical protein